jgi:molybdopterin-binding protein
MLEVKEISKHFSAFRLEDVTFRVEDGDYFVILGPSGAGKTMLLEILAGIVRPEEGAVMVDATEITRQKIQERPFGLVFQDLAIFPHLRVRDNIGYGLKNKNVNRKEARQKVEATAARLEIAHLLDRRPATLSGGELQRVALARALVRKPRYLLLDEPLSSLDIPLRQGLRALLKRLNAEGQTIIHVTHDYEEALVLASKVAVFDQGRVVQSGPAEEVFHHPGTEFVARFTGIRNYFPARLFREEDRQYAELENGQLIRLTTAEPEGTGIVMVKGEDILLSLEQLPSSATNQFEGRIKEITPYPFGFEVEVDAGTVFTARITRESLQYLALKPGKKVWLSFKASSARFVRA